MFQAFFSALISQHLIDYVMTVQSLQMHVKPTTTDALLIQLQTKPLQKVRYLRYN